MWRHFTWCIFTFMPPRPWRCARGPYHSLRPTVPSYWVTHASTTTWPQHSLKRPKKRELKRRDQSRHQQLLTSIRPPCQLVRYRHPSIHLYRHHGTPSLLLKTSSQRYKLRSLRKRRRYHFQVCQKLIYPRKTGSLNRISDQTARLLDGRKTISFLARGSSI